MSVHYLSHVWKKEVDVHGTHLLALLCYADMASDDGSSWGSKAYIAHNIRRSVGTARTVTNDLEAAHKIVIVTRESTSDLVYVVCPDLNGTYEELCKKHNVMEAPYVPLPTNKRGKDHFVQSSEALQSSVPPPTEFSIPPLQSSGDEPSIEPSIKRHIPANVGRRSSKAKTGRSKEELDLLFNAIALGSLGVPHSELTRAEVKRVVSLRKQILASDDTITPAELTAVYADYETTKPQYRLQAPLKIAARVSALRRKGQHAAAPEIVLSDLSVDQIRFAELTGRNLSSASDRLAVWRTPPGTIARELGTLNDNSLDK